MPSSQSPESPSRPSGEGSRDRTAIFSTLVARIRLNDFCPALERLLPLAVLMLPASESSPEDSIVWFEIQPLV
eukprot:2513602-Rhodomonas_salina.1